MPDPKADDNVATEDNVEPILCGPDGEIKQVVTAHNHARLAFEVINVGAGDSLEIKWTLEYT